MKKLAALAAGCCLLTALLCSCEGGAPAVPSGPQPAGSVQPSVFLSADPLTAYPVEKRSTLPAGETISFTVGVQENVHASDRGGDRLQAWIIRSLEGLRSLYAQDPNPNEIDYIAPYTADFFEEKALVALFITEGSGSIRHRIPALKRDGTELAIDLVTDRPYMFTCDMAYWRILLEVDREAAAGIDRVSCRELVTQNAGADAAH